MKKIITSMAVVLVTSTLTLNAADTEDWYFKVGLGFADVSYPTEIEDALNTLKNAGATTTTVAVDIGVYWPLNNQMLLGFNINGVGDRYEILGNEMQINTYNYALSGIYNFNKIRDGLFVRADIGIAKAVVDTNIGYGATSDNGYGIGLGVGYAWEFDGWGVSPELLINSYSIEDETYSSGQFLVNFMF